MSNVKKTNCRNVLDLFWAHWRLVFSVYSVVRRCSARRHAYVLGGRSMQMWKSWRATKSSAAPRVRRLLTRGNHRHDSNTNNHSTQLFSACFYRAFSDKCRVVDVLTKAIHDAFVYRISQNHDRAIDGRPPTTSGDVTILSCSELVKVKPLHGQPMYTLTSGWLFVRKLVIMVNFWDDWCGAGSQRQVWRGEVIVTWVPFTCWLGKRQMTN